MLWAFEFQILQWIGLGNPTISEKFEYLYSIVQVSSDTGSAFGTCSSNIFGWS